MLVSRGRNPSAAEVITQLLTNKERFKIEKDVEKLEKNLSGNKDMRKLPGAVFVVDPNSERIAASL